jgi:phosphoribosylformylglycinamidine synthase
VNAALFGESASRIVVSVRPERLEALAAMAERCGVPWAAIGSTGGSRVTITVDGATEVDVDVKDAESRWATAIENKMTRT